MARQPKTPPKPAAAGPADQGLKVMARSPSGIRRAGRHWGPDAEIVSLADLTEDQVELLESEPALLTSRVDMPAEAPDA